MKWQSFFCATDEKFQDLLRFARSEIGGLMTERQKMLADREMLNLWKQFIYEEAMNGELRDYRHLDKIIRAGLFKKKYLQCGNKYSACWIFIFCDGEFGYFDGYRYCNEIPVSIAKLLDVERDLSNDEDVHIQNGNYVINY